MVKPTQAYTGSFRFGRKRHSFYALQLNQTKIFFLRFQTTNLLFRISIHNSCYDLTQTTKLYYCIFTIIKKQITIVSSSCHLNATVNHLRSTSTYTSYFILLFLVTKYYKSAVYVGGDSVKSDQTSIGPNFKKPQNNNIRLILIYTYLVIKWCIAY